MDGFSRLARTPSSDHVSSQDECSSSDIHLLSPSAPKNASKPTSPFNYPLDYTKHRGLSDVERWNNLTIQSIIQSPFFSPLEMIPKSPNILELACGHGSWCISVAEFWKDCRVVGLDIEAIQPDLKLVGRDDLAERITWVHSNMLRPLPFPDEHFDVIRMQHTEYAIPEKEWLNVLKEVNRVLRPGGLFETFQQALIFPCPKFPPRHEPLPSPHPVADKDYTRYSARYHISPKLYNHDPRDHTHLKVAHKAMLDKRQLNPAIISTIPLYLDSQFERTYVGATIHVEMPPSSFMEKTTASKEIEQSLVKEGAKAFLDVLRLDYRNANLEINIDIDAYRHLNHTMHIVLACKEAIWEEFEIQNPNLTRDDFEFLMKNWELDMRDRMNLRDNLGKDLNWRISLNDEDDDRKIWRQLTFGFHEKDGPWDAQSIPEPCRSLRLFRAVKPTPTPLMLE